MSRKPVPDEHHIVRHVGSQLLIREGDKVVGCFPQAFQLRAAESYLSASWLEFFGGPKHQQITDVIAAIGKARQVKPSHGIAIGNVATVKEACGSFGQKIRVIHEPSDDNPNPAYTAVRRFSSDEIQLLELLAGEGGAWSEVYEARDYLSRAD
jgi:hypothetical protein